MRRRLAISNSTNVKAILKSTNARISALTQALAFVCLMVFSHLTPFVSNIFGSKSYRGTLDRVRNDNLDFTLGHDNGFNAKHCVNL